MVLLPTQQLIYPGITVSLMSISFVKNKAPLGGCLRMEGIASKETANRQSQQHRTKKKHIRNVGSKSHPFFSRKHDTKQSSETGRLLSISKVTFSSNLGSAISPISLNSVNTSITRSSFVNNSSPDCGGAIFLGETGPFLNILGSKFIENSAQSSGSAIYVFHYSSLEVCSILVKKSLFMGNVISGDDPLAMEEPWRLSVCIATIRQFFWKTFRLCTIQPAMGLRLCSYTAGEPQTLLL